MTTTLFLRDHLLRPLVNETPGTSDATDSLGRDVQDDDTDYIGRPLVATVWALDTAYALGEYVELSTGEVLKAIVAGDSNVTAEPTAPGYGETVVDGTVTWEQVTT